MPNSKVKMISTSYYKRNSVINLNLDDKLLVSQIIKAQNMNIERNLGSNLFNSILAEITTGIVSPRYATLLQDYIQPALVEWVTYIALPYLNYKFVNKGVVKKSSDNSESADLNEINFLRQDIRNDAEYLSDRLVKFLISNVDTYPEYNTGNNDCDDIRPKKNNFFNGVYLSGNDYKDDEGNNY
jgi:hypothetical protein